MNSTKVADIPISLRRRQALQATTVGELLKAVEGLPHELRLDLGGSAVVYMGVTRVKHPGQPVYDALEINYPAGAF